MTSTLAVVEQVALYLGNPWKFNRLGEPSDWRYEVTDGTGHALIFLCNHYQHKGKFRISGSFPPSRTSPNHDDHRTIGISINRSPKDIAADISRRLIPHYLEAFDRAAEAKQQQQETAQHVKHIGQALIKVTGGTLGYGRSNHTIHFDNGSAEIWGGGSVDIDLRSLSPETAIKIAAIAIEAAKQEQSS